MIWDPAWTYTFNLTGLPLAEIERRVFLAYYEEPWPESALRSYIQALLIGDVPWSTVSRDVNDRYANRLIRRLLSRAGIRCDRIDVPGGRKVAMLRLESDLQPLMEWPHREASGQHALICGNAGTWRAWAQIPRDESPAGKARFVRRALLSRAMRGGG